MGAQTLSSSLGQNVIVENVVGASGMIGAQAVARADPDGDTLPLGGTSNAIGAAFYKKPGGDPIASRSNKQRGCADPVTRDQTGRSPLIVTRRPERVCG
jgi:hypothetical protein